MFPDTLPLAKVSREMKQILQNLNDGTTELADVPCPSVKAGHLLIRTRRSLISAGTERMLVDFGKGNIFSKARQQPDKVRMVLDKIRTDGLLPTLNSVRSKLDQPLPLGYCNVGTVIEVGSGVVGFSRGDRVVSNGKHAEIVCVPRNLCAKIPDSVSDDEAVLTVLGAIALQGIRLAEPTLGERFVVIGLGLIGLLAVQLLRAQGCKVLGIDLDPAKLALAENLGAEILNLSSGEDPILRGQSFSSGRGVDGTIITASTKSNEPVRQAAQMCRKRGRIVLIGVTGLELSRADFYEKELTFQVSCSYGPGRYDPEYEEKGRDYPIGFVRWTEQRNFEAILDLLEDKRLSTDALISHRYLLDDAPDAYQLISNGTPSLGIVIEYPGAPEGGKDDARCGTKPVKSTANRPRRKVDEPGIGFIGAGNYAMQVLMPAFKRSGAELIVAASGTGVSGLHAAKKFGFREATTDVGMLLTRPDVNAVVIATRHDSHSRMVQDALDAGKHVFVEKPLALNPGQLEDIQAAYQRATDHAGSPVLMVGFNRRFSPHVKRMKQLLTQLHEPKVFVVTVNAGTVPAEHWVQDKAVGGGRIIGEGCHFIDLTRYLADAPIVSCKVSVIGNAPGVVVRDDKVTFNLGFADGSIGTIHYLANGHRSFPKERVEVFCGGRILQLDNFRSLRGYGWPGFKSMNLWRQDKGNAACVAAFVAAVREGDMAPIPFPELEEVTRVSFEVALQADT